MDYPIITASYNILKMCVNSIKVFTSRMVFISNYVTVTLLSF